MISRRSVASVVRPPPSLAEANSSSSSADRALMCSKTATSLIRGLRGWRSMCRDPRYRRSRSPIRNPSISVRIRFRKAPVSLTRLSGTEPRIESYAWHVALAHDEAAGQEEPTPMYEPLTPPPPLTPPQAPVAGPVGPFTTPETATPPRRRSAGLGLVVGAVLASSLLASGGTYLAVSAAQRPVNSAPAGAKTEVAVAAGQTPVVDIVKTVSPAVVTIVADGITSTDPTTGQTGTGTATGSGVIFDANGLILTNHHVVAGNPSKLTVNLTDGRSFDASVYGIDTLTDLAIVKVDATGLPTAPIGDSSTIQVGQQAIAIGSPLGTFTDSVTSGIISALGRSIPVESGQLSNLIQTDTAINPGNSGGPLLDPSGKVIGINTAVAGDSQGIGFAIPINIARPLLAQASAGQALARPWLGVQFLTIDPTVKSEAGLPVANGAWVPSADAL